MTVEHLHSAAQLAHVLPLSSLAVVLFTAAWSRDSRVVLSSFERVAASFPARDRPPAQNVVAFYAVNLAIDELHASEPQRADQPLGGKLLDVVSGRDTAAGAAADNGYAAAMTVHNATQNLPWFPAMRIFVSDGGSSCSGGAAGGAMPGIAPVTYYGSYTPATMRQFIVETGRQLLLEKAAANGISAPPSRYSMPWGLVFRGGRPDRDTAEPDLQIQCAESHKAEEVSCADTAALTYLAALAVSEGDPVELSPDQFTSAVYGSGSNNSIGVLLFIAGGARSLELQHALFWTYLRNATAILGTEQGPGYIQRHWFLSVVDTASYAEVARRYGIDGSQNGPSVVLVDTNNDNLVSWPTPPSSTADAAERLRAFAQSAPGSLRPPPAHSATSGGSAADVPAAAAAAATRGPVWIVVGAPWCGFSQRVSAVYREFARRAPREVTVLTVIAEADGGGLPDAFDALVEGFPTVLRPDADDVAGFVEFRGPHHVGDLLRIARAEIDAPRGG